ncbi:MAG: Asp-tRNA(Asn)/Glu-tRNA(Gln) amidotransferase subunit GatC [Deferribacteraceae bacterium]|jgi:aspartyl-tRNA(Asn)/glutamyl-tRNA(Gln) amidotransferase subunit C|nr:Asp-tRNA(Asn)/Glu-tRNA(Gln) amidotransferase subunit GatC [Deferribacteraceae bacterium]
MISEKDIAYVADLAKIKLNDGEVKKFTSDLNDIVEYAAMLKEVDVTGIEPMYSPNIDEGTPEREDAVKLSLTQSEALAASRYVDRGHFRVPKIIEGQ